MVLIILGQAWTPWVNWQVMNPQLLTLAGDTPLDDLVGLPI